MSNMFVMGTGLVDAGVVEGGLAVAEGLLGDTSTGTC